MVNKEPARAIKLERIEKGEDSVHSWRGYNLLILKGEEVGRAAMAEYLEKKRREVGNTIYKGVLCEAANW